MPESAMTTEDLEAALTALAWKGSDFCRAAGVARATVSRWRNGETPIPLWAAKFLALTLELQRLHADYVMPPRKGGAMDDAEAVEEPPTD